MYKFHTTLHVRPPGVPTTTPVQLQGETLLALNFPTGLNEPFPITFEQAEAMLEKMERMFCEPDGSFVWVSSGEPAWQVDGHLYDRHQRLLYVELKGTCTPEHFDKLLAAFGWPNVPLVFQLIQEGVLIDEQSFRQNAGHQ